MPTANTPEEVSRLISEAMTNKDMDAALSLYEPDATFAMPKGFGEGSVTGIDALRQTFETFMAMDPTLAVNHEYSLLAGDTAMVVGNWTLKFTGPDGEAGEAEGRYTDTLRRQDDGSWLFVIDNPNGSN
jgi:ketosteroid isomerase-like protein